MSRGGGSGRIIGGGEMIGTWEGGNDVKQGEGQGGWGGGEKRASPGKPAEYFTGEWGGGGEGSNSVEISPGSAWKKEPSSVGNWCDDVQSPRSEHGEENPLVGALQGAQGVKKSLANW